MRSHKGLILGMAVLMGCLALGASYFSGPAQGQAPPPPIPLVPPGKVGKYQIAVGTAFTTDARVVNPLRVFRCDTETGVVAEWDERNRFWREFGK